MHMPALLLALLLAGDGGKVQWSRDIDASFSQAKQAGRPILFYFTADW